ncbi:MAG: FtsX-like permease family protein [Ignavibacteriae bacterium]|nr:MAG: FtsX-like permease family protein [Ignavibacteriota bacterium]
MEFSEIFKMSLTAIRSNKLRSALTLLGIIVGVFSIIGVMTAVQVLQNSIEDGLSGLGANTFQVQKQPVMANHAEWHKAMKRKDIRYAQGMIVKEKMTLALSVALESWKGGQTIQFGSLKTNPSVAIAGEEPDGITTNNWSIKDGRSLTDDEVRYSSYVAILGNDVVKKLFPRGGAIGSDIRIGDDRYRVIGTFEPKGSSLGGNDDNRVVIPLTTFLNSYGKLRSIHIMIKARNAGLYDDCVEEARMLLRTIRNVAPGDEDDFTIFSNDSLISTFNDFTKYVKLGVGFMSFISLLAAGIGIMNIMLVSVTERTREIGIRKALGARKSNILSQFITEAIVLCQIGGVAGVGLGILGGNITALALNFPPVFPIDWAIIGFAITSFVGIVFGVYPAWKAANLDPIDSLRYE